MQEVVEVRIRELGRVSYFLTCGITLSISDYCIVEAERGIDYGQVISEVEMIEGLYNIDEPLKKILRKATQEDLNKIEQNRREINKAMATCQAKIQEHKLDMKLVDGEYSFDQTKLIFYFTAEGRVDFRELVKDLAKDFRARIELRQIGVRDEAKMFGGFGPCGRALCCTLFLKDFGTVSIKMAKEQSLSLNPTKISGVCGRLMCCLSYEHEAYKALSNGLPKTGNKIDTEEGRGKVVCVNPLRRCATIILEDGKQITKCY